MRQHEEDIEDTKCGRRHGKEINGDEVEHMIIEKGPPYLGGRLLLPNHVFGYRRLGNMNIQLEQLSVNPRGSPQRIGLTHVSNELLYGWIDEWTFMLLPPAFPAPVPSRALSCHRRTVSGCTMWRASAQ